MIKNIQYQPLWQVLFLVIALVSTSAVEYRNRTSRKLRKLIIRRDLFQQSERQSSSTNGYDSPTHRTLRRNNALVAIEQSNEVGYGVQQFLLSKQSLATYGGEEGQTQRALGGRYRRRKWKQGGGKGGKGKGKSNSSKKSKTSKYKYGYKGKGKSGSKKYSKYSKSKKGSSKKRTGKGYKKSLGSLCKNYDFTPTPYNFKNTFTKSGGFFDQLATMRGGGNRRGLPATSLTSYQFHGELCSPNTLETARSIEDLSIFISLIEATGLADIFLCAGPFTVLAPSNDAFNENPDLLKGLFNPKNYPAVKDLLLYHIVPGYYATTDFVNGTLPTLLFGEYIDVTLNPLMFNQAGVVQGDIVGCNGGINVIDDVLIPRNSPILPEICEILDFRVPGQFPTIDTPFGSIFNRKLVTNSETYDIDHRGLQFDGARCIPNSLDLARQNPDLTTFVQLLDAADLGDLFLCAGPFTVLAPVNEVFENLDPILLAYLTHPRNMELLQEVLLYHILPGYFPSDRLEARPFETLLFGYDVDVTLDPVQFNDANAITIDIGACNGVIHTIDDLLIPGDQDFCDDFDFSADRRQLQDGDDQDGGEECEPNVLEIARQDPNLVTVVALIEAAGLEDIFGCPGPFTALLPNNSAFDNLDPEDVDFLLNPANRDILEDILLYHILPGATMTTEFQVGPTETLLLGETVDVTFLPLRFDGANVVTRDIESCNGLIHVIDQVLLPFDLPEPTDPPTSSPTPDPFCLPYTFDFQQRRLQDGGAGCTTNVLETIRQDPNLSIATTLIDLAGLSPIFECAGPFTALVPINTAFDDVDPDLLDMLLDPANIEQLQNFLSYHILPSAIRENEFAAAFPGIEYDTLFSGNPVTVTVDPLQFDGRNVTTPDIESCNGIIHILDGVLNPFEVPPPPTVAPTPDPFCEDYVFTSIDVNRRFLQDGGAGCTTNVMETIRQDPDLTIATTLFDLAGLAPIFDCAGPFTALIPNNEAFDAVDPELLDMLLDPANVEQLQNFLLYHILPTAIRGNEFASAVPGLEYETLFPANTVTVTQDPLQFDGRGVTSPDNEACNGIIHVLDGVLNPFETPPPPTIAPTPDAFCSDYTFASTNRRLQDGGAGCMTNVLETIRQDPNLSIVTTLIDLAGLAPVFECAGPFTALAPVNTAFDTVDQDLIDMLLDPANADQLRDFMLYHIFPGARLSTDFSAAEYETLFANNFIDVTVNPLQFDGRGVVTPDTAACNGIIHTLDGVLNPFETPVPPSLAPTAVPTAAPATPVPTAAPVPGATPVPTATPTSAPTGAPTSAPTGAPTSAATAAPTIAPTSGATTSAPVPLMPTQTPREIVRVQNFYIAYVAPNAGREPTEEEYNEMLVRTTDWFVEWIMAEYADDPDVEIIDAEASIDFTQYEGGIPEDRFNILIDFDFADIAYTVDSTVPSSADLFEILRQSITADYILEKVRTYEGTPFESTNEVFFAASEELVPP